VRYISGTKLDERIVRCDLDLGYRDGRQYGRGKSGGQVCLLVHCWVCIDKTASRFVMSCDRIMTLGVVGGVRRRNENVVKRSCTSSRRVLLEVEVTGNKVRIFGLVLL
jgi:hypothetical protein